MPRSTEDAPPRREFSLRGRVVGWLSVPLGVLVVFNAFFSYYSASDAVNRAYDRSLTASLKSIAEGIHSVNGQIQVDIPYAALDTFDGDVQEHVFHAVIGPDGRRVTGYADLPAPDENLEDGQIRIRDTLYHGEAVRLGAVAKRLYDPALQGGDAVLILFAETTETRQHLTRELFYASLRRQLLQILVGAVVLLIALTNAMRPLLELREAVRRRDEDDLTPVPDTNVPSEVKPVIEAINHHMERLSRMLEARRRFLADAAHQLRTPLAVLGTQAEFGQRQDDAASMRQTFEGQLRTIRATRRLVNQMLTLSHAEPANGIVHERLPLDLVALVREVAVELSPLALRRHQDLAFEEHPATVMMSGNAQMLREMIANLVDNALRYTPAGGHITLAVGHFGDRAVLQVEDDGPGIPAAERERVFQRFYRILGQAAVEGSGLGLAIVREICWAHDGQVSLATPASGQGLVVTLEFPALP